MAKRYREVRKRLRAAGWSKVRSSGSHETWRDPVSRRVVTVAGKDSDTVPPGTLAAIRRATALDDLR
jgi:predicted RNA binding protein YcfA (HicA-like mRNA interferase family)